MTGPQLLTAEQATQLFHDAGLVDLSPKWIQNQIDRGLIPAKVIARKRRVRSDVIEAMIEHWMGEVAPTGAEAKAKPTVPNTPDISIKTSMCNTSAAEFLASQGVKLAEINFYGGGS